jgi:hypothetical protein
MGDSSSMGSSKAAFLDLHLILGFMMSSPSKVYFIPEFSEQIKKLIYTSSFSYHKNDFRNMFTILSNGQGAEFGSLQLQIVASGSRIEIELFFYSDSPLPMNEHLTFSVRPTQHGSFLYSSAEVQKVVDEVFSRIAEREPRVVKNALSLFLGGLS